MAIVESQGGTLQVLNTDLSPDAYTTLGQVTSIQGLRGGSATVIDVSTLASTRREKRMGLADEGQVSADIFYDPDDAGHTFMEGLRAGRTLATFRVTIPDSGSPDTYFQFSGYVLDFPINLNVDEVVQGTVTIEITGAVTKT